MAVNPSRLAAGVASIVLVAITLSPVLRDNPYDDGFPLSTYPMFASARGPSHRMSYALGLTRSGERRTLSPRLAGSLEVLQAYRNIEQAVAGGRGAQQKLCRAIADRVRDAGDEDIVTVRIVNAKHDALDVLLRDQLGVERELTRCRVKP
jgi:hypothetical protein